jgi:ABC-type amino acid transport substrate-binding protein
MIDAEARGTLMVGTERIARRLIPTGVLRASINVGNPVLVRRDSSTDPPYGVSIDIAKELAERLGVGIEFIVFESASVIARSTATWQSMRPYGLPRASSPRNDEGHALCAFIC